MFDFILSVIISLIVNIKIVPYLDMFKNYYTMKGQDFTDTYYILLAVSYITVGAIAYFIIQLIKIFMNKWDF